MPNDSSRPTTRQKALSINLDQEIYGTFSEIGAGQGHKKRTVVYSHMWT